MHKDTIKSQVAWQAAQELELFLDRIDFHDSEERKMTFDYSPKKFFEDANSILTKHFSLKWRNAKMLLFALASVPEISVSFAKCLLNFPAEKKY